MLSVRRRVRGFLKTSLVWGCAFSGVHLGLGLVNAVLVARWTPAMQQWILWGTVAWAGFGALSGLVFAALVLGVERRRRLGELSPWRFALWGFLAGGAIPLLPVGVLGLAGSPVAWSTVAVLGGGGVVVGTWLATASLRMARRTGELAPVSSGTTSLPPVT